MLLDSGGKGKFEILFILHVVNQQGLRQDSEAATGWSILVAYLDLLEVFYWSFFKHAWCRFETYFYSPHL